MRFAIIVSIIGGANFPHFRLNTHVIVVVMRLDLVIGKQMEMVHGMDTEPNR